MLVFASALAQGAPPPQTAAAIKDVTAQTRRYFDAVRRNDAVELDAIFSPDYTEVSPLGQVDKRAQVVGFYQVAARAQTGQASELGEVTVDDLVVSVYGDVAVVIAGESFKMSVAGKPVSRPMRSTLVWHRRSGVWTLVASHHTTIRPPVAPGKTVERERVREFTDTLLIDRQPVSAVRCPVCFSVVAARRAACRSPSLNTRTGS
jgi:ketosteroid isomerase-like protein